MRVCVFASFHHCHNAAAGGKVQAMYQISCILFEVAGSLKPAAIPQPEGVIRLQFNYDYSIVKNDKLIYCPPPPPPPIAGSVVWQRECALGKASINGDAWWLIHQATHRWVCKRFVSAFLFCAALPCLSFFFLVVVCPSDETVPERPKRLPHNRATHPSRNHLNKRNRNTIGK